MRSSDIADMVERTQFKKRRRDKLGGLSIRRIVVRGLIGLVRLWQTLFSVWMAPTCRFVPSCSDYSIQALREHGIWMGSWLTIRRLCRCHPFGGSGLDEVPACSNHHHSHQTGSTTVKDTSNGLKSI